MATAIHIDYLSDNTAVIELCKRYWEIDSEGRFVHTLASLSKEAGMSSHNFGELVFSSCDAYTLDDTCASCSSSHIYQNRTDFTRRRKELIQGYKWLCNGCKAAEQARAAAARQIQEEQQRALIHEHFRTRSRQFNFNDLSLRDGVFLVSVFRQLASEDLHTIYPLARTTQPLTPATEFDMGLLRHLYGRGLISVHPESPLEAFKFEEGVPSQFYISHVMWRLTANTESPNLNLAFVQQIEQAFQSRHWRVEWHDEVVPLWNEIARHECMSYLKLALDDHKLPFTPGEKTVQMFNRVINHYSISQVYSFIWRAAKDAAAFYTRERVAKQHAANTVVGAIERAAERASANGWEIRHYGRERRLPESVLNQVFFNRVLQIGDDGFTSVPSWGATQEVEED